MKKDGVTTEIIMYLGKKEKILFYFIFLSREENRFNFGNVELEGMVVAQVELVSKTRLATGMKSRLGP